MSHTAEGTDPQAPAGDDSQTRRDFLTVTTTLVGAAGAGLALWPLIDSMNPAADTLALSTVEVDLKPIQPGQRITVKWRGKPVFIDHRTPAQIEKAQADDAARLPDPQADKDRVQKPQWLVLVGVCTHLGCVPLGQKKGQERGEWGGWFCPCHGSHYDFSGRIRKGPAPRNLEVPKYTFLNETTIRIG
ncbi:MAG: ubiquinol-cytochrome c reductase iron-sulfur subunit [Alphaproteobacteria bacterium]|nr:ubiquinol-cytochrome c reductase iron-sulfur subunit [Alphaproteobacteria bacterium]